MERGESYTESGLKSSHLTEEDKKGLALFHQTISQQLNARLTESPKFFGVLVVASAGYGYVLATFGADDARIFVLASAVIYAAVVWALGYLAALGYAFRFLQNSQHRIEDALGWAAYRPKGTGEPPEQFKHPGDIIWCLPGIYQAHAVGLTVFLLMIVWTFYWYVDETWWALPTAILASLAGVAFAAVINAYYVKKYRRVRVPPSGSAKN